MSKILTFVFMTKKRGGWLHGQASFLEGMIMIAESGRLEAQSGTLKAGS